jgi:YVTN family beta-propeller protein
MRFLRSAGLAACTLLLIFVAGCSDVFRPVAIPIFPPGPDPQIVQRAVVINNNGGGPGTAMIIDAAADATLAIFNVGTNPAYAATISNTTFVVNKGDDTVSVISNFAAGGAPANTIVMPAGSQPQFILAKDPATLYTANANGTVSVISEAQQVVTATVPVGSNPVSIAETLDLKKIYVVNQGSNNLTVINTQDLTPGLVPVIAVGSSPISAVLNSDGTLLFVLNRGSNNVSVIDTLTDTVTATLNVGASPSAMIFDPALNRLYVANTGDNTVSIFAGAVGLPGFIATVPLGPTGLAPVAITALADGSRVYVADRDSNNVAVIETTGNTVRKYIAVGTTPTSITSGSGSIRVVVTNFGSSSITDIQTSNDVVARTLPASSPNPSLVVPLQ